MTDPTAAALLRAVLDNPDDDPVRLIYADRLEDIGEYDRAEFIHIQCELHPYQAQRDWLQQLPVNQWLGSSEQRQLLRRLAPLVKRHTELCKAHVLNCATWSRAFVESVLGKDWLRGSASWQWGWSRGFVSDITCPCRDWLDNGDAITAVQPIQTVRFTTRMDMNVDYCYSHGFVTMGFRPEGPSYPCSELGVTLCSAPTEDEKKLLKRRWPRVEQWILPDD